MNHNFIIIERDPVVQMDLVGALQQNYPASVVHICATADDLNGNIPIGTGSVRLFVTASILSGLKDSALQRILGDDGHLICIGTPDTHAFPFVTLETPFTTAMILDAVANDAPCPPVSRHEVHT